MKILKIQIRSAQNVGKVRISQKKTSRGHLMPFSPWTGQSAVHIQQQDSTKLVDRTGQKQPELENINQ